MKRQFSHRLVVVSNRLPVTVIQANDSWQAIPATGGLVTALSPVMERNRGVWIGWSGASAEVPSDELLRTWDADHRYTLVDVPLTPDEVSGYYHGFANQAVWPVFHDFLGRARFELEHWKMYDAVNAKFAKSVADALRPGDFVWIHDYQLMLTAQHLRALGAQQVLSFFLHIPFPSVDMFRRIPWRNEILRALLAFDLLGFQTLHDRRNFVHCVRELLPEAETSVRGREASIEWNGRVIRAGHFPISIDFREFNDHANDPGIATTAVSLRKRYDCERLILGVDRLDYSKGVPERFAALERAFEKYPDLQGKISLIQIVVPSRTHVPEYQDQKSLVEGLAGRINGRFSREGWVPIHYMFRAVDRPELLAHYRACEIALVTPLRDGMNLVAKEYCASTVDGNGVLILSEFAGAADQLEPYALVVNPYDRENTADAIHTAFNMTTHERKKRMSGLRSEVRRNDVHRWLSWFLESPSALPGPSPPESASVSTAPMPHPMLAASPMRIQLEAE